MSGSLVAKIVADAEKVKAAILKAVTEVDNVVLPDAAVYEPLVAQVANAISPGSANIVNIAYVWLETCAKALDAGGAAAESNFANAGLDTTAIAQVKGLIPALKAASNPATPPAS